MAAHTQAQLLALSCFLLFETFTDILGSKFDYYRYLRPGRSRLGMLLGKLLSTAVYPQSLT